MVDDDFTQDRSTDEPDQDEDGDDDSDYNAVPRVGRQGVADEEEEENDLESSGGSGKALNKYENSSNHASKSVGKSSTNTPAVSKKIPAAKKLAIPPPEQVRLTRPQDEDEQPGPPSPSIKNPLQVH